MLFLRFFCRLTMRLNEWGVDHNGIKNAIALAVAGVLCSLIMFAAGIYCLMHGFAGGFIFVAFGLLPLFFGALAAANHLSPAWPHIAKAITELEGSKQK